MKKRSRFCSKTLRKRAVAVALRRAMQQRSAATARAGPRWIHLSLACLATFALTRLLDRFGAAPPRASSAGLEPAAAAPPRRRSPRRGAAARRGARAARGPRGDGRRGDAHRRAARRAQPRRPPRRRRQVCAAGDAGRRLLHRDRLPDRDRRAQPRPARAAARAVVPRVRQHRQDGARRVCDRAADVSGRRPRGARRSLWTQRLGWTLQCHTAVVVFAAARGSDSSGRRSSLRRIAS